ISGTGDGEVIAATGTGPCYSGPITATKCGNGVIDPLEDCEVGDCCSARCRLEPAGTPCTSDENDCTYDLCNAAGTCTHQPVPPRECRRAEAPAGACHSTCVEGLRECKRTCASGGRARRDCRANCAQRSACTAPGTRLRTMAYLVS